MENALDFSIPIVSVHPGDVEAFSSEKPHDFPYKIINVVALGILALPENQPINFDELEKRMQVKRLNRFPCVMFKVEQISIILFKNGKMIITGIKRREDIPIIQDNISSHLNVHGIMFNNFEIKIQNLVAMCQLGKTINLEMACLTLTNCIYEPEQFPAAIIKNSSGGAFLLFSNSKIICLGMRNLDNLERSLCDLIQSIFENDIFIDLQSMSFEEEFEEEELD